MAAASLLRISGPRSQLHLGGAVRGEVEGPVGALFCWSWCPADLVVLFSSGKGDLGFPGSVGMAAVSAGRVGILFLRCGLPLSGVCSAARGRSDGFVQEFVVGVGLRRLVLGEEMALDCRQRPVLGLEESSTSPCAFIVQDPVGCGG